MTTFEYKGISKDGIDVSGVIKAYDEFEAVSQLKEVCSIVTQISPVKERKSLSEIKIGKDKIKDKELAILCSQFSIILSAGLPIVRCVEMVADQAKTKYARELLHKVADDIASGYGMAQSFEKNGPTLPRTFIETIRAGEQSGTLEACFRRLQKYYEKTSKTKAKVISALTYPAIVVVVAIIVFIIIMVVAVPMFTRVFSEMGTDIPLITKGMIAVSNFFTGSWWVLILIAALCFVAYKLIVRTPEGRYTLSQLSLNKFPLHKIRSMNVASQFASTMSTMIGAGLPVVNALDVTANVVDNYVFSEGIRVVSDSVKQGQGISDSMAKNPCFPRMLTEMTGVGESSGSLESTLDVIGDYYENEVQIATERLLAMMEPAITVGLAVFTVLLLLSVYLPMFNLYGGI